MNADTNKLPYLSRIIDITSMVSGTVAEAKKLKLNRSFNAKLFWKKKNNKLMDSLKRTTNDHTCWYCVRQVSDGILNLGLDSSIQEIYWQIRAICEEK